MNYARNISSGPSDRNLNPKLQEGKSFIGILVMGQAKGLGTAALQYCPAL